MASVTYVVSKTNQPQGGYINPDKFDCEALKSEVELLDMKNENISPSLVGRVVDYLTRFMLSGNRDKSFYIARLGARIIGFEDYFQDALDQIKGLDDRSIIKACKIACFDSVYRAGIKAYSNVEDINPNQSTISNIRVMVQRSIYFFEKYGPITADGFTFENAYTKKINTGDGDFLTRDTLWDFKVSIHEPTIKHTLQLLIYYLMGKRTGKRIFMSVEKIGIFNPRLNKVYVYEMSRLSNETILEVERDIIGYEN